MILRYFFVYGQLLFPENDGWCDDGTVQYHEGIVDMRRCCCSLWRLFFAANIVTEYIFSIQNENKVKLIWNQCRLITERKNKKNVYITLRKQHQFYTDQLNCQ